MTKAELIKRLEAAGSEEAAAEAKIILTELFGVSAQAQLACREREYDASVLEPIIERRASREPLAYIIGHTYFCSEKYYLSKDTLIPRQDTEMLVECAVRELRYRGRFLDLCTGSGCVAISTLARRPDLEAVAVDISAGACEMAKKNARENGARGKIEITQADLTEYTPDGTYDAILSNPPYVKTAAIDTLSPEVRSEPRTALDGGEDGMHFYRAILDGYAHVLAEDGFFAFEIGYDQSQDIEKEAALRSMSCEIIRDYSGNARVALLRRSS
ncbi:MAG: peptide chain release factor N(5)-glutamine methyltransferase [Clostridia bacterium]|nr:peptide chain release factor N(5)-glutamine methyltransferase [Clostridia bacterium]